MTEGRDSRGILGRSQTTAPNMPGAQRGLPPPACPANGGREERLSAQCGGGAGRGPKAIPQRLTLALSRGSGRAAPHPAFTSVTPTYFQLCSLFIPDLLLEALSPDPRHSVQVELPSHLPQFRPHRVSHPRGCPSQKPASRPCLVPLHHSCLLRLPPSKRLKGR